MAMTPLKVDLTDHAHLGYGAQLTAHRLARSHCRMKQRPSFPGWTSRWPGTVPTRGAAAVGARPAATRPKITPGEGAQHLPPRPGPWHGFQCRAQPYGAKLAAGGVVDADVLAAMGTIERHRFVDSALINQAYEDTSLPIGLGQTISKPRCGGAHAGTAAQRARHQARAGCWKWAPGLRLPGGGVEPAGHRGLQHRALRGPA